MPNYMDVSKNNNAFLPLQSGRKSLENDVYFLKLCVIRVDKATQTYRQNASLNIVDSWPNSWKIPVSNIRPCRAGSCQTVHPWKKSPRFFLTHLLCFIFFLHSDLWLEAANRAKQPSPPLVPPSHTKRFALQPNISLPFLSFFFIFSMTHDLFLFAWCHHLCFVLVFLVFFFLVRRTEASNASYWGWKCYFSTSAELSLRWFKRQVSNDSFFLCDE